MLHCDIACEHVVRRTPQCLSDYASMSTQCLRLDVLKAMLNVRRCLSESKVMIYLSLPLLARRPLILLPYGAEVL